MALLYGMGRFNIESLGLTPNVLLPMEPVGFNLATEVENTKSRKWKDGVKVTAGAAITQRTYTLTLTIEAITWFTMQLAIGELAQSSASVVLKDVKYATVPSASPYEITDAQLTDADVLASVTTSGTWGSARPLTKVTTSPAAKDEFQVVTGSTKLVFHSGAAGSPIAYRVKNSYTNVPSIGVEPNYKTIDAFSFGGICWSDEELYRIDIPRMSTLSTPSINVESPTSFEFQYEAIVVGSARLPFNLYDLTGETLP